MEYINYTPHDIKVVKGDSVTTIPASGMVVRISSRRVLVGNVGGFDLFTTIYGEPETVVAGVATPGMPPQQEGAKIIVSGLVRDKCPTRYDLVSPGDQVRDEKGAIIGCRSFDTN